MSVYTFNMCMFKTQVLSYGFSSIKKSNQIKKIKNKPMKTGPAMAGQVAMALFSVYMRTVQLVFLVLINIY